MRRMLPTILLSLLTVVCLGASVILMRDGSLARITGWHRFRPGMSLFPPENLSRLKDTSWMRIKDLHDTIECERGKDGTWWIVMPFRDRMAPGAAKAILDFTASARLVDTLPLNGTTRKSLREFGVESAPHSIVLKTRNGSGHSMSTSARYTLGSASPWLAAVGDGSGLLPTTYLRTDFYGRDKRIHVVTGNILDIFRNGLSGLRDPHPFALHEDDVLSVEVRQKVVQGDGTTSEKSLFLARESAQVPWVIRSPYLCRADEERAGALLSDLLRLRAVRIEEVSQVKLPAEHRIDITLRTDNDKSYTLRIYEPFASASDGRKVCYATVSDRPVVFTLAAEPRMRRNGAYAGIVNSMLTLPVLPKKKRLQLLEQRRQIFLDDLPLSADALRSRHFTDINISDIDKVILISRYDRNPLRLQRIPGDTEGQVRDVWMYSAEGKRYSEADRVIVRSFLESMVTVPVQEFLRDIDVTEDPRPVMQEYGLDKPDYTLIVQPQRCTARAVLFGLDMPLMQDRAARLFYMKRIRRRGSAPYWAGTEKDSRSIARLSPSLMKHFSTSALYWRCRNMVQFPISSLRTLTLDYQKAPLVLNYDYIGEKWTGTLNGEDISPRVNPHRTDFYIRHLQNIRVKQWLRPNDEDALAALQSPVFTVKLDLEITDYSDIEQIVVDASSLSTAQETMPTPGGSRMGYVKKMLNDEEMTDADRAFRDIALGERKVEHKTITIEIAPVNSYSKTPLFYGRIREDGSLFILSDADAEGLDGQLLDK